MATSRRTVSFRWRNTQPDHRPGEWVLRSACVEARRWHQNGFPQMRIAINVSMVQFRSPNFVSMVQHVLCDIGIEPAMVELKSPSR